MKTVDSQESHGGGVTVLVAGYLIGEDNVKRSFIQSFFLTPQDNGFFVLNDIFRLVEEVEHQQVSQGLANGNAEPHAAEEAFPPQQGEHALDQTVSVDDEVLNKEELYKPSENGLVIEDEEPTTDVINKVPTITPVMVAEVSPVAAQGDMPKKSYASIASPVMISGRETYVEEKRTTGSQVGSRGRFEGVEIFMVAVAATVEGTLILDLTSVGDDIQIEPTMSGITESTTLLATKEAMLAQQLELLPKTKQRGEPVALDLKLHYLDHELIA